MNANDVIESYITDVALRLPRRQRNDVAFELRALLMEELEARAETELREADAAMAIALLRAFGRPAEVAARYRPALTIVDPADGRAFLRATVIGLAVIWVVGLLARLAQPVGSAGGYLGLLGQWWGSTVIPSLWWPGVLVTGFAGAAWMRRRWPGTGAWTPRAADRLQGGRAATVLAVIGIACGTFVLFEPHWLLDVAFGGRAAPAAHAALTYTDTFLQRQAPWLLLLIVLNIPMLLGVIARDCWTPGLRRVHLGLSLAMCAALAWTVLDGPVMLAPASDHAIRFCMALIVAVTLLDLGIKRLRRIRPIPFQGASR